MCALIRTMMVVIMLLVGGLIISLPFDLARAGKGTWNYIEAYIISSTDIDPFPKGCNALSFLLVATAGGRIEYLAVVRSAKASEDLKVLFIPPVMLPGRGAPDINVLQKAVERLLGTRVDYSIELMLEKFPALVDWVGGAALKSQSMTLNGAEVKALLLREGSTRARISRFRSVLESLFYDKLKGMGEFQVAGLINPIDDCTSTKMEMKVLQGQLLYLRRGVQWLVFKTLSSKEGGVAAAREWLLRKPGNVKVCITTIGHIAGEAALLRRELGDSGIPISGVHNGAKSATVGIRLLLPRRLGATDADVKFRKEARALADRIVESISSSQRFSRYKPLKVIGGSSPDTLQVIIGYPNGTITRRR